eukprot:tig00020556_g11063.t1
MDAAQQVRAGLFSVVDTNRSKSIDRGEYYYATNETVPVQQRDSAFTQADVNRSNDLDYEEYLRLPYYASAAMYTSGGGASSVTTTFSSSSSSGDSGSRSVSVSEYSASSGPASSGGGSESFGGSGSATAYTTYSPGTILLDKPVVAALPLDAPIIATDIPIAPPQPVVVSAPDCCSSEVPSLRAAVDGLRASLGAHDARYNELQAAVARAQADVSGLSGRAAGLEASVAGLSSSSDGGVDVAELARIEGRLSAAESLAGVHESRLSGLDGRLASLEARPAAPATDYAPLAARLAAAEAALTGAEGRLDALESASPRAAVDPALAARLATAESDLSAARTDLTTLEGRVRAVESKPTDPRFSQMEARDVEQDGRLAALEDLAARLEARLAPGEGDDALGPRVRSLEVSVNDVKNQLTSVSASAAAAAAAGSAGGLTTDQVTELVNARLAEVNESIAALRGQFTSTATVSASGEELASVHRHVADVESALAGVKATCCADAGHESRLAALEARMTELSSLLVDLRTLVRGQTTTTVETVVREAPVVVAPPPPPPVEEECPIQVHPLVQQIMTEAQQQAAKAASSTTTTTTTTTTASSTVAAATGPATTTTGSSYMTHTLELDEEGQLLELMEAAGGERLCESGSAEAAGAAPLEEEAWADAFEGDFDLAVSPFDL